jgi:type I restriction enzyme S subunit
MKMGNLGRGTIKLEKVEYINPMEEYEEKHILKKNDFLFNTRNSADLVGKVSLWKNELPFSLYNSNILKIEFKKGFINEYINYLFNSNALLNLLKLTSKGTTNVSAIYYKDLSLIKIWIPENVEEQKDIVNRRTTSNVSRRSVKL